MDNTVEMFVFLTIVLDLADRVNNGAVMLAAEGAANLGEGVVGQLLTQKHGYLAWLRDATGVAFGTEITGA